MAERGRTIVGVLKQYNKFVKNAFRDFISPTITYADIVIPGHRNNRISVDFIVQHIKNMAKKISDLVTELTRCRSVMGKIGTGISLKTMRFYINKFEGLIEEMRTSVAHLKSYVQMLTRLQRDNKPPKRCLPVHKGRTHTIV